MNLVEKIRWIAWILLFSLAASTASFSFDNTLPIGQFIHTAWGQKEGAPQKIYTITQTKDGYLWLASHQGLVRFDGYTFELYTPPTGPALPFLIPYALLALPEGDLWIGFAGAAISRLKNGQAENYTDQDGVPAGIVRSLARDWEGTIWAASSGGLLRLEGKRWQNVGKEWNFTGKSAQALLVDSKGTLWVAADNGIAFLPHGTKVFQSISIHVDPVVQLVESPDGRLWINEAGRSVRPLPVDINLPPSGTVEIQLASQGIFFARDGGLWMTTLGDGIRRAPVPEQLKGKFDKFSSALESFTTKNGLTDNYAGNIFQDREGNIWVGTIAGLDRFRMSGVVPVPLPFWAPNHILSPGDKGEMWTFFPNRIFHIGKKAINEIKVSGFRAVYVLDAYRGPDEITWLAFSEPVLVRLEKGHFSRFPMPKEIPDFFSDAIHITEDRSGILWMAVAWHGIFRRERGVWSRLDVPPELMKERPMWAFTDDLGRVWFGYAEGAIIYLEHGQIHTVSTAENSPVKFVIVIGGRNQHVWVGGTAGIVLFDQDKFHMLIPADRPSFDRVYVVKELADGSLWLSERRGLIHIDAREVHRFLEDHSYRVHYELFDALDGMPGTFQNGEHMLVEGTDGRIWFGADHGIAWLAPATIPVRAPPPILIRSVTAADKQVAIQHGLTLPPRSSSLQIEYTGLNLALPERVRYRYKLDGVDKDWQDAGIRREAFYTNLGPGKYRFHVTARNEGGEWNTEEAALDFRIAPAWFQTIWFRAFYICIFLFLCWMLYQIRLRQLERRFQATLEVRVAERTRIARELHDTLLQTFSASLLRFQSVLNMLPGRPEEARKRVERAMEQASNAIAEGRDAVHELRAGASATADLVQSIKNFVSELVSSHTSENPPGFRVHIEGVPRNLNPMIRDEIYRIAAEALRNAIRYAAARRIEVEIRYDEQQLRLRVHDDGKGMDPDVLERGHAPGHWGLRGMRERAKLLDGSFEVWSQAGSGTEIELTVPATKAYSKPASRWSSFLWSAGGILK